MSSSAPADERPELSFGMLGYGFMGKAHSNALRTLPYMFWPNAARVDMHTIAGRTETGVAEAATRFGWRNYTTDWREIVDDPSIDIFDNVASDGTHFEPTLAAVRAGKHVICEKPLASTTEEANALADAAADAGVKNLTCFNYRFVPAVRLAHEMIKNGELGEIYSANFRYSQEWRTDAPANLPTPTGALDVIGCHAIDQARYLVGEIDTVSAFITNPVTDASRAEPIDAVASIVQFEDGATGGLSASLIAPGRRNMLSWEINGSKGSLVWDLEQLNILKVFRRTGQPTDGFADVIVCEAQHPFMDVWWPSGHVLGWEHSHINMLAHFVEAVLGRTELAPHAATFADGAAAARVAAAIAMAATSGERTRVARRA